MHSAVVHCLSREEFSELDAISTRSVQSGSSCLSIRFLLFSRGDVGRVKQSKMVIVEFFVIVAIKVGLYFPNSFSVCLRCSFYVNLFLFWESAGSSNSFSSLFALPSGENPCAVLQKSIEDTVSHLVQEVWIR